MKKLILIILLLIPVSIFAQPAELSKEIAEFTGGYYVGQLDEDTHIVEGARYHDHHSLIASINDMVNSYSDLHFAVYWEKHKDSEEMLYSGIVWGDINQPNAESYIIFIRKGSHKVAIIQVKD